MYLSSPYLRRLHEIIQLALHFESLGEEWYYVGIGEKKGVVAVLGN